VLRHRGQVLLEKRPSSGIWGGLWVFPEFGGKNPARHCLAEFGCTLSGQQSLPVFAHGFTHFRLEILPIVCEVAQLELRAESPGRAWLAEDEAVAAAVPVPVRKLLLLL
jgi:A/G-specific adenine glycosylase